MFDIMLRKASVCLLVLYIVLIVAPHLFISQTDKAQASEKSLSGNSNQALVTGIRHWSGSARTRIVIDLDRAVGYTDHLLKEDAALKKPPRLYIDLTSAKLSPHLTEAIPIELGLLKRVRAGQYSPDTVRVVLDLASVAEYKIFPLSDPFRVVIDVLGKGQVVQQKKTPKVTKKEQPRAFKMVIDAGHGGKDPGAVGPTGLREKDVVLRIAKRVRDKVKKQLGWKVVMTRQDDRFIPLDERTGIANSENAALFLSIHANACENRSVAGIESYVLGTTTDKAALRLAAKENNISPKQVSDLQVILADLRLNDPQKVIPSSRLADSVQKALIKGLHKQYGNVRDLGVKEAPFVVLIGAEMPSILVEVSFISNPREEKRLRDPRYLDALADAIVAGLKKYAHDTKLVLDQPSISVSTALNSN